MPLTPWETTLVVLCLGVELDARWAARQGDAVLRRPGTGLALELLTDLAPAALVRLGVRGESSLAQLHVDHVAVDFALEGDEEIARRLARAWLDALVGASVRPSPGPSPDP
ncbi:hypothetical protein [Kineococcus rhizosphaerae]|uniref:Uncharacterized protein n=1 Tax=Kineococcus rhizosphaerae TaxID=559628 RepID=A0A2T0R5W7_9ACTN|nr:hypothetical protein [Kineococcus rhizosphaerae]PRY16575.1 hypothetical protein CLV37_1034 [Kineococcus rhizosphaerae]